MENSRLCDSLHWVERHQDLPTEPDIDPSRAGGRGRFSQAAGRPALPFVRRAQGCPEPTARSSGAAPHDRTCAPGSTAVRSPHSIRRTRDAADPEHRFWRYPASISFPIPTAVDRHAIGSRPPVVPWFDCPEAIPQKDTADLFSWLPNERGGEAVVSWLPQHRDHERAQRSNRWASRVPAQLLPPPDQPGIRRPRRVLDRPRRVAFIDSSMAPAARMG